MDHVTQRIFVILSLLSALVSHTKQRGRQKLIVLICLEKIALKDNFNG